MAFRDTAEYLPECLDSMLAQTYPDWELIAVNDRSTDGSREIVEEYSGRDARIRLFDSPGERLNPALQEAHLHITGELVNRMDSDDRMPVYKLQAMYDRWKEFGKGTVVAGGTEHFRDDGEVGEGFRRYDKWLNQVAAQGSHLEEIYKECVIPSHCWLMHRDDLADAGGFTDVYPEDYDLTFRLYRQGLQIVGLDRILHHWRDRSNRISRTWEEYKDNRYFDLKVKYFYELDRDPSRPLVLWGAGRNGKDMARLLLEKERGFHWLTDNTNKVGHNVYGIVMQHQDVLSTLSNPQIMVVVSAPDAQIDIRDRLNTLGKLPRKDFWFFA